MKIAVCLSGLPRSIEYTVKSILAYFSGDGHEYDFFCHTWNYNIWKLQLPIRRSEIEYVDTSKLVEILDCMSPKKIIIESAENMIKYNNNINVKYGSLSYSMMMANHIKRVYEFENNFKYDFVIKARFDSVFQPFTHMNLHMEKSERTIYYPHVGRIPYEYNRINASDCIFVGDSWGMDIICDLYRELRRKSSIVRYDDPDQVGPGTTAFVYGTGHGLRMLKHDSLQEILYRKEAAGLDVIHDFEKIKNIHLSFYGGTV